MTLKENVIREAGKYRINVYIKQIWKDSLPTASNTARPSTGQWPRIRFMCLNFSLQTLLVSLHSESQDLVSNGVWALKWLDLPCLDCLTTVQFGFSLFFLLAVLRSWDGQLVPCRIAQSSRCFRKSRKVFTSFIAVKFQIRDESFRKSVLLVCLYVVELYTSVYN